MDPNNQNQLGDQQPQTQSFQPMTPPVVPETASQIPQQPMYSATPMQPINQKDAGHTLGIVSLIMSLLGLGLVGIVLGILAINKSKKSGHTMNVMGLIGIIWGVVSGFIILILVGLVLNNFQSAQDKSRDTISMTRMNSVYSKLEEYYNETSSYPEAIEISKFPGISPNALNSGSEAKIAVIKGSKNEAEALAQRAPTTSEPYQYIPFSCTADACKGYVLRILLDRPSSSTQNPYTKLGLNNNWLN